MGTPLLGRVWWIAIGAGAAALALLSLASCVTPVPPPIVVPPTPAVRTVSATFAGPTTPTVTLAIETDPPREPVACVFNRPQHTICFIPPSWPIPYGVTLTLSADGYAPVSHFVELFVNAPPDRPDAPTFDASGNLEVPLLLSLRPLIRARSGLVRGVGAAYLDDTGVFRPKGTSLLWALDGWKRDDRPRVRENLRYIAQQRADYVRILAQVNWVGQTIDPAWPDYVDQLAGLLDAAYDEFGLRTKVTVIGGGAADPIDAGRKVCRAVAGRQQKVFALEATNEGNLDEATTVQLARVLTTCGVPIVSVGLGNQGIDVINRASAAAGATGSVLHTERTEAENGARQVRQAWDLRLLQRVPRENAEPPGPASSVGQLTDPFKLGAFRTLSTILGAAAFCLHTGHGVYGRTYTTAQGVRRIANLYDAQLDATFAAVMQAGDWLPDGVENWPKYNEQYRSPVYAEGTFNKVYGAYDGARFAYMVFGAEGPTQVRAIRAAAFRVRHPVTGDVLATYDLAVDQRVPGPALWAYVLEGSVR